MAVIDAVYKKDSSQLCKLMTDGADLEECLKNKQMTEGIFLMLGSPKEHKVLDGFLKGGLLGFFKIFRIYYVLSPTTGFLGFEQVFFGDKRHG